ncbi:histidine triad nucleotide-binding protein [soil metagenome]
MQGVIEAVDENCIFCKIIRGDFGTELVAESPNAIAFNDNSPAAPTHVLVVPRTHVESLSELDDPDLGSELLTLAKAVAQQTGVAETGFRLVTNIGEQAGQSVFHLHFHVIGGRALSGSMG